MTTHKFGKYAGIIDPHIAIYRARCAFCGARIEFHDSARKKTKKHYFCDDDCKADFWILHQPDNPAYREVVKRRGRLSHGKLGELPDGRQRRHKTRKFRHLNQRRISSYPRWDIMINSPTQQPISSNKPHIIDTVQKKEVQNL